jgi:transposase
MAAGQSLGVNGGLIGRWKNELADNETATFPGKGNRKPEQQRIHELEAENRRLRMQRDILKKAILSSTGHCNTGLEFLRWCLKRQRFAWPLIQP